MEDNWRTIRAVHSSITGIPPHVVDYIAVEDILVNFVQGLSTTSIADLYEMDMSYIEEVLKDYLFCTGWVQDLKFNPLKVFKESFAESEIFNNKIISYNIKYGYDIPPFSLFNVCKLYIKIKEQIELWDTK